ncbi:trxA [Wigglesworthia glossinidia endosymbiont of Glossina brevipalpis]|uniref:Thioredoxin n=1 Tax=Wigglesworthia glossinidia brevipalpis TaxID=36870 RepID=Q8D2Q0_WIGBR|nr:trxA [Wigglesworthia glossinidia endosymbiont of Glossina brevipalpis]
MNNKEIISVNDEDFEINVLKNKKPVLVDFWAQWCMPCKSMIPILKKISEKYVNKLEVFKINIEKNSIYQEKYLVKSIPSFFLFFKEKIIDKKIGIVSQKQLEIFIDENLNRL